MTQKMIITLVLIAIVAILVGITGYLVFLNRSEVPRGVFTTTVQPTDKDERVNKPTNWSCIPSNIKPDEDSVGTGSLAQELIRLNAQCNSSGKLIAKLIPSESNLLASAGNLVASEKEIYLKRATSCGGTTYLGEQENEHAEIRALKKQYHVIVLGCWPVNYRGPFPP